MESELGGTELRQGTFAEYGRPPRFAQRALANRLLAASALRNRSHQNQA